MKRCEAHGLEDKRHSGFKVLGATGFNNANPTAFFCSSLCIHCVKAYPNRLEWVTYEPQCCWNNTRLKDNLVCSKTTSEATRATGRPIERHLNHNSHNLRTSLQIDVQPSVQTSRSPLLIQGLISKSIFEDAGSIRPATNY